MERHEPCWKGNGYLILRNFFASVPGSDYAPGLDTGETGSMLKRSTTGVHNYELYKSISENENLIGIVKSLLRDNIYIHQSRINYKLPFVGTGWHWHSDFETWHYQDGMPGMNCLTAMIPLTENTMYNGPLLVIPGSHKKFYCAPKPTRSFSAQENFADQKEGLPDPAALLEIGGNIEAVICSPGDLVLFDCNILHGSVANMTPDKRTNLFFVYNAVSNALVEPFSGQEPRPEEMGTRNILKIF